MLECRIFKDELNDLAEERLNRFLEFYCIKKEQIVSVQFNTIKITDNNREKFINKILLMFENNK